jgi:NAD(P)-dependent dehydrogenase (short-subunit alcohol dehydrogenase family)
MLEAIVSDHTFPSINVGKNRVPIHEFSDADWHKIIRVDLDGVFFCSRAVSASMIAGRNGTIINITSVFGLVPARLQCSYTAAKAGVANFTRSHALEVGQYGIRVNGVAPAPSSQKGLGRCFTARRISRETACSAIFPWEPQARAGRHCNYRALSGLRRREVYYRAHPGGRWRLDRGISSRLVERAGAV